MSSKMSPGRFERASVLCDLARAFVEVNGNPTPGIIPPMLEVDGEGLPIAYCDNFPARELDNHYLIVDDYREPNSKRRRKLSVYWFDDGRTLVSGFRPRRPARTPDEADPHRICREGALMAASAGARPWPVPWRWLPPP